MATSLRTLKRKHPEELNTGSDGPSARRMRAVSAVPIPTDMREEFLPLPSVHSPPQVSAPYSQPYQLVSFSYTEEREQRFDDSALRFFVQPPAGADLNHRYEYWIRKKEERGRLDGLLNACLREEVAGERARATCITWRGVMTKYAWPHF